MRILVISAHPDDETLGCGGTLLKCMKLGHELNWLILTKAHVPDWSPEIIAQKADEVDKVAEAYGMNTVRWLGNPSKHLAEVPLDKIIDSIKETIIKVQPEVVYLVHGGDVHSDHRIGFDATLSALRPPVMKHYGVKRLLCYETLSSTEASPPFTTTAFLPNVFTDISQSIDEKLGIMNFYHSEIQKDPLPRGPEAIKALARLRGATIGVRYAEAFMQIREIN